MHTTDQATQIDSRIGLPVFGVSLIALPPARVRHRLSGIQDLIEVSAPQDCLYRCPVATLHLSVFHFFWTRRPQGAGGPAEWEKGKAAILAAMAAMTSSMRPFTLGRGTVQVGDAAIFLKFDASPAIERLRDALDGIATPSCANRPAIQHVSLFRYRRNVPLQAVQAACAGLPPFGDWEVDALQLAHEKVYASMDFSLIDEFALR